MTDETFTPEQEGLKRRARSAIGLGVLASVVVELALGFGSLWDPGFYWMAAVGGIALAAVILETISIARALRRTGPPFENLRWWWPRRG